MERWRDPTSANGIVPKKQSIYNLAMIVMNIKIWGIIKVLLWIVRLIVRRGLIGYNEMRDKDFNIY